MMNTMVDEARTRKPAPDEVLGEAVRNTRAAGDQLDDMLEFVRLVHRVRRAESVADDTER
jgi:hypothetical protein